jgi:hypothetical protein
LQACHGPNIPEIAEFDCKKFYCFYTLAPVKSRIAVLVQRI